VQASPAPLAVPAPEAAEVEAELSIASTPMSILVVEDTPDARTMLSELLLVLGHCVEGVGSAEEALDLLAHKQFDVLLTDHSLPGMSVLDEITHGAQDRPQPDHQN
jgi:CheY-like chemotaxis protein